MPYLQSPRSGVLKRACRFKDFKQLPAAGASGSWQYVGNPDILVLELDKDARLHEVQYFGRKGREYTVSMEIKDTTSDLSVVKNSGTYSSEKDLDHIYYGFDVLFDIPVNLDSGKRYEISSKIIGPPSWYGKKGQTLVNFEGINFTFIASDSLIQNGTSERSGQFSVFLFT